ncbi:alpha amylase C-terminal domain-containing protein [Synechocystis sp. B12]|nr:alpha amylase C-terminal domain-containing protein [Synechocystis sp. B12]
MIAFHRWEQGGINDDVVVVANFSNEPRYNYTLGFPVEGFWALRFNSDWQGYSDAFGNFLSTDTRAESGEYDGFPYHGLVSIAPYSVLIFSR